MIHGNRAPRPARSVEQASRIAGFFRKGDCLGKQFRYRSIVPYACKSPFPRPSLAPAALALTCALALSACAGTTERTTPASTLAPMPAAAREPTELYWWRSAGDPLLAELVETGLAQNRDLTCQALSLRRANERARTHARRIDTRIGRLFDTRGTDVDTAEEAARAFTYADRRADLAARIARSYIATRELQEMLDAHEETLATTRDNAEIAAFREEAGLVSGVDTGLAGTALAASNDDIGTLQIRYEESRHALAQLVGLSDVALEAKLGETGQVPDIGTLPPEETTPEDIARRADLLALERRLIAHLIESRVSDEDLAAALADLKDPAVPTETDTATPARAVVRQWREARDAALNELATSRDRMALSAERQTKLEDAMSRARDTVEDARLAYRTGTGTMATLYVAEDAMRKLSDARISARSARAQATIGSWDAQGLGWSEADLDPPAPPADGPEVLVCE
ncbi:TolC family protein [Novosphingobium mangrovi (ex Hu et al. 2023)]|uniref:TolC family protein n=1 Tax=Novosphingobium mangrovi (ex Hu et al. 2023) TaxID=2930094 RepID=A0ABT0ABE2_9SPHN|nr:TolC family protein [Novosphingobium mangrovi (ex Hu et al. 2023)]MCJ1960513.1 TolC family protein [Novosphingobium mangrovi (ex Hu et al. 2023)]